MSSLNDQTLLLLTAGLTLFGTIANGVLALMRDRWKSDIEERNRAWDIQDRERIAREDKEDRKNKADLLISETKRIAGDLALKTEHTAQKQLELSKLNANSVLAEIKDTKEVSKSAFHEANGAKLAIASVEERFMAQALSRDEKQTGKIAEINATTQETNQRIKAGLPVVGGESVNRETRGDKQ